MHHDPPDLILCITVVMTHHLSVSVTNCPQTCSSCIYNVILVGMYYKYRLRHREYNNFLTDVDILINRNINLTKHKQQRNTLEGVVQGKVS